MSEVPGFYDGGGPAFPVNPCDIAGQPILYATCRMSLRDWFAGAALQGLAAVSLSPCPAELLAHRAYEIADAMIAERKAVQP